jgi:SAM-dependent methyltransferase
MSVNFGPGYHAEIGALVDRSAVRPLRRAVVSPLRARCVGCRRGCGRPPTTRRRDRAGRGGVDGPATPRPRRTVVAADISVGMLHAARTRFGDRRFRPVVADGQALPFAESTFDSVICQLGLMFFPDPARGLAEFHRVLLPAMSGRRVRHLCTRAGTDVGSARRHTEPVSSGSAGPAPPVVCAGGCRTPRTADGHGGLPRDQREAEHTREQLPVLR